MKTALSYGAAMTIAGAVLNLLLYIAGWHDSIEKLKSAQWIGGVGAALISATCLALAMRERRAEFPRDREWSYGPALGTGALTALFGSLFALVTGYAYFGLINRGFGEVIYQTQVAALEGRGMSAAQIERIEPMLRRFLGPAVMTIIQAVTGFAWSFVLSLVVAIFVRRRAPEPTANGLPPEVG